jgi:hypothetical protein
VAATIFPELIQSSFPLKSVTIPPASESNKPPAAISHFDRPISKKPSKRPAAVYAKSKAALPGRLIPEVSLINSSF